VRALQAFSPSAVVADPMEASYLFDRSIKTIFRGDVNRNLSFTGHGPITLTRDRDFLIFVWGDAQTSGRAEFVPGARVNLTDDFSFTTGLEDVRPRESTSPPGKLGSYTAVGDQFTPDSFTLNLGTGFDCTRSIMFGCNHTWQSGLLGVGHRVTAQAPAVSSAPSD